MIGLVLAAIVTTGTWTMQTSDGKTYLDTRWTDGAHHDNDGRTVNPADYGLGNIQSINGHVTFKQHREAGDFTFEGWMKNGDGGGTYTFNENERFFSALSRRGYSFEDMGQKVAIANLDVTLAYVTQVERMGVHPSTGNLITFRALDITPDWVKELRDAGVSGLSGDQIVPLKALKVDERYLRDLASVGYAHLWAHELVTLKAMKIDSAYVKYLNAHGFKNIPVEKLIEMKAMKV